MIFQKLLNIKCMFWLSLLLLPETFLILRRIQEDDIKNVYLSSTCTDFKETWIFSTSSSSSSSVICQTTGPKLLPKRFLHIVRSRASSFKWQYPLLSLRSSSSFLRLLPHLLVTSICPLIFIIIIIIISNLSNDRSKASSKTIPPHSAI